MHDKPATPHDHGEAPAELAAALEALRMRGAAQRAPMRWRQVEAFARRAVAYGGATRRLLDARLAQLVRACAEACDAPRPDTPTGMPPTPSRGPLGELADGTGRTLPVTLHAHADAGADPEPPPARARQQGTRARAPAVRKPDTAPGTPPVSLASRAAAADAESLQYFRRTWSRLAAEQHLAQSRSSLPGNAGPLHSHTLVHRSLALMRELSPGYFEHFMAHVDALAWLEAADE